MLKRPCVGSACSLLLQTGITSAQHALLLLESVIQKKGKAQTIERVVAEMLQYIGPLTKEAGSVLKVAAGHSSAAVVAMLLDWSHCEKDQLDLQARSCHLALMQASLYPSSKTCIMSVVHTRG